MLAIKVFKKTSPNGINRWWCGCALRKQVNGVFSDGYEFSKESMVIEEDMERNAPVEETKKGLIFRLPVEWIISPYKKPEGYPETIEVDMEEVRLLIESLI